MTRELELIETRQEERFEILKDLICAFKREGDSLESVLDFIHPINNFSKYSVECIQKLYEQA